MRKDYFKGTKLLFLGKSVILAAPAAGQLLCWLPWTLKAWELQLPGASILLLYAQQTVKENGSQRSWSCQLALHTDSGLSG